MSFRGLAYLSLKPSLRANFYFGLYATCEKKNTELLSYTTVNIVQLLSSPEISPNMYHPKV